MALTAAEVWRKNNVAGVPASGPHPPDKSEIIAWGTYLETLLSGSSTGLAYATKSALSADLLHLANVTAIVYADPTAAFNGLYLKSGGSGSGSWARIGDLPNSITRLTVTGGTANAIIATAPETPTAPGAKLFILTPTANNTGPTTIAYNGGGAVAIKSALDASLAANALLNNVPVVMIWNVDHFQIIVSVPVDASGILTDALAAKAAAEAAAAAAAATAAALSSALAGVIIQPRPTGRLSLTSGVSVTTTDVVGATSIYYMAGPHITCNASSILADVAAQATLPLDSNAAHTGYHQGARDFNVYRINDSGTIRIGSGPAHTSDVTRLAEVHLFGNTGVWTNAGTINVRFNTASGDFVSVGADRAVLIGSFTTTADGQTEDSAANRYLYNVYDQVLRVCRGVIETADNWNYTTAAFRQANNSAANGFNLMVGLPGNLMDAEAVSLASNSVGNVFMAVGIGIDNTTNVAQLMTPATALTANAKTALLGKYRGYPAAGRRSFKWLEYSTASGVTTWYGDNGQPSLTQCGISGVILM